MKTIGISAPVRSSAIRRTLDALGEVLNVRFEERTYGRDTGVDAWIFPEEGLAFRDRILRCELPCYVVVRDSDLVSCESVSNVDFSRHHSLPNVLNGRRITASEASQSKSLPRPFEGMVVLASKGSSPLWVAQESGACQHHFVALPIPELNSGEPLFHYFHGRQFLHLLPLVSFLRTLGEDHHWEQPPLQACFMVDDPNLHWRTYGFVDFAKIALDAEKFNYHVSFATIPLDTWFVHMPTADLFKMNASRLSLSIHGNDHTARELGRACSNGECDRILRQALWRIGRMERHSGMEVSRVMTPPHGACSEGILRRMACLGFEAASISRGSLSHYNKQAPWVQTIGMRPSDIVGGLPVLPRFSLSGSCHNSVLLAVVLRQPIIPMGHHGDLADGLQVLGDLATFVNSLGSVRWGSLKQVSRSHFARRSSGNTMLVRMFTKRIELCVPDGTNQIVVESHSLRVRDSIPLAWRRQGEGGGWTLHQSDMPISIGPGKRIEIIAEPSEPFFAETHEVAKTRIWPVVRRQLAEARDRVTPLLRRVSLSRAK